MSTYIAVFAMVLAYVALVAAYFALRTLAKVRRATAGLQRGGRTESLLEGAERHEEHLALLRDEVADLRGYVDRSATAAVNGAEAAAHAGLAGAVSAEVARAVAAAAKAEPGREERGALRNIALVRYDALPGMSGRMSFSLAILDSDSDGVVISAIAAPTDTRVYAKGVTAGAGEHELSPEERQAVTSAIGSRRARKLAG
jgi:hypothetical protein